jgi:hypothetical protein
MNSRIFIDGPTVYEYQGKLFEFHSYSGPHPLKKDGELTKRVGKKFYEFYAEFDKLPAEEKAKYKVGGGSYII